MDNRIEISKGFEEDEVAMREAFVNLTDEERFIVACELSEIMIRIQYENGVLKEDNNFKLTNEKDYQDVYELKKIREGKHTKS